MALLISMLLIAGFGLHPGLYLVAIGCWFAFQGK